MIHGEAAGGYNAIGKLRRANVAANERKHLQPDSIRYECDRLHTAAIVSCLARCCVSRSGCSPPRPSARNSPIRSAKARSLTARPSIHAPSNGLAMFRRAAASRARQQLRRRSASPPISRVQFSVGGAGALGHDSRFGELAGWSNAPICAIERIACPPGSAQRDRTARHRAAIKRIPQLAARSFWRALQLDEHEKCRTAFDDHNGPRFGDGTTGLPG